MKSVKNIILSVLLMFCFVAGTVNGKEVRIEQNEPPTITHFPPTMAFKGSAIPIYAQVKDDTGKITGVNLYYTNSKQVAPIKLAMKKTSKHTYSGLIPPDFFFDGGFSKVWYYIEAEDSFEDKGETTWFPVLLKDPSEEQLDTPDAQDASPQGESPATSAGSAGGQASAMPAGATTGTAAGGGIGTAGWVAGGVLVSAGAVAGGIAIADSSSDDEGDGGGGGPVAPCNNITEPGQDAAETHVVELGQRSGTFVLRYNTFFQKDRITVTYEGAVLFDTGCVGRSASVPLSYSGRSSRVTVHVQPNCAGGSGTRWEFTVQCP